MTSTAGGGSIAVQISGEALATSGFSFPSGSEVTMTDGWEVRFTHVLVTVGEVTISRDPELDPSDQSRMGTVVAEAKGPWAVDLHREGTAPGIDGESTAIPLAVLAAQTRNGGAPFSADERYAFSYRALAASTGAKKLNFEGDEETEALYERMISGGYSILYAGTATFVAAKGTCKTTDAGYDFEKVPASVAFELGFEAPTSYLNCQNQNNQGEPFEGEEYPRGIAVPANAAATAQLTFHLDHAFYSDVQHEPLLYFGQIAAQLVGKTELGTLRTGDGGVNEGRPLVTMDNLVGVDPAAFTDGEGRPFPWRVCDASPLPATPQMGFDTGTLPVDSGGDPRRALRDYRDFMAYVTSAQGHLNSGEGLCYPKRDYPSPP